MRLRFPGGGCGASMSPAASAHKLPSTAKNRRLTARLYGGDQRTRIRQELLLGIGGVRALKAIGINPRVIHMNEGHSAFAPLEVIRMRIQEDGMNFGDALRETAASGVFTTHTPVAAGHDRFDGGLIDEHLGPMGDALGLDHNGLMALGRVDPQNPHEPFCMTVLAFKTSRRANAPTCRRPAWPASTTPR